MSGFSLLSFCAFLLVFDFVGIYDMVAGVVVGGGQGGGGGVISCNVGGFEVACGNEHDGVVRNEEYSNIGVNGEIIDAEGTKGNDDVGVDEQGGDER